MTFSDYLETQKVLILDGAMGTELQRRGADISIPLWSAKALAEHPKTILSIHCDYINAGADIITTNTFRTDSRTFQKAGLTQENAHQATIKAVNLAREAIRITAVKRKIWIAGSMAPLEDCYHPELAPDYQTAFAEHSLKAAWLAQAGVDFILIETMNSLNEALAATRAALATGLPVATSFILRDKDHILNGDAIFPTYLALKKESITIFSINCTHHSIITSFLNTYARRIQLPLMAYANAGIFNSQKGWKKDHQFTPLFYQKIAKTWLNQGVKIIGGCCGTNPSYIRLLAQTKSPV
jgi:S-methylmethionine-dependent homocysteine/selenocysteine methylase